MKIAIVDDDVSVRNALARVLTADEIETSTFASGAEFLDSLREQIPDCLTLDLQMPGMSGLEVQQALRDAGLSTPVIVITGNDDSTVVKRTLDAGAIACLVKPVDLGLLLDAVQRAVAGIRAKPVG
ncbi:hypothetical protein MesoLj113c_28240 [Mesorhizobium sp. 113-3-9]|uniref:response regulator transcription factor n=1 Tax=Mesorhizobium sp. 113-3-9 TaxID=2744517 RepID=UPI0019289E8C|nr:response regulator [Mesorhizobium sp. 113-3-9]BCG86714.1 hypothetical protein MesoLj113c_28240 [Mesorhizobium sp. 113-3-9]